jgi:hypothetical protein
MFEGLALRKSLYGAGFAALLAGVAIKRGFSSRFSAVDTEAVWKMAEKKTLAPVIALSHGGGESSLFLVCAFIPFCLVSGTFPVST